MQYRILGRTGWKVGAVSMGCWGIGGQWGPVEEKQAHDTIRAALDTETLAKIDEICPPGV